MCFLLTAHSFNQVDLLQGMGKYFVTLAKDLGYEPTILALGRSDGRDGQRARNSLRVIASPDRTNLFGQWTLMLHWLFPSCQCGELWPCSFCYSSAFSP